MAHYLSLPVHSPFDWEALLAFLGARATPGVETVTDSAYARTVDHAGEPQTLSVSYDRGSASLRAESSVDLKEVRVGEMVARVQQIFRADVSTSQIETFLG